MTIRKTLFAALACTAVLGTLAVAQEKADPEKGKELFEQCSVCHNADSTEKKMGPGLKGLFKKAKLNNGKKVTDENVMAIINAGGNGLPAYEEMLSKEEKANVLAYLKTL